MSFENLLRLALAKLQKYSCEVDEEKSGHVDVVVELINSLVS
jgi:hypothetical protein